MAKKGLEFMMEYVQDYLHGETERLFFDLDFAHYLTQNYPAMKRKDPEMAEGFVFYLMEEGLDRAGDLTDAQHKNSSARSSRNLRMLWPKEYGNPSLTCLGFLSIRFPRRILPFSFYWIPLGLLLL
jgi:hypothetical protein